MSLRFPSGISNQVPKPVYDYITELYQSITDLSNQLNSLSAAQQKLSNSISTSASTPVDPTVARAKIGAASVSPNTPHTIPLAKLSTANGSLTINADGSLTWVDPT